MTRNKLYSAAICSLATTLFVTASFAYGQGWDRINQRSLPLDADTQVSGHGDYVTIFTVGTGLNHVMNTWGSRAQCVFDSTGLGCDDTYGWTSYVSSVAAGWPYSEAYGTQIRGVRVLDNIGSGSISQVSEGLDYVVANAGALSLALVDIGGWINPTLEAQINYMLMAGVIVVVPAGNDGVDACLTSPARLNTNPNSNLIVVGASWFSSTTDYEALTSWSNHGECVDIFAPGEDIQGAWPMPYPQMEKQVSMSGTGVAAAHVAGAIAILLEQSRCHNGKTCKEELLADATSGVLQNLPPNTPNKLLYVE